MIVLTGTSLNKRHQELNTKVNEAAKSNLNFEEIKNISEKSDVDKLFKIDLASKYRNIDYVLEVFRSGDSLYISRALKCDWIVDDEFSEFINPQYLEENIFLFMSPKMKKKLLATLSKRIHNDDKRAEEFYHYCMHNKMCSLGMNFLLHTNLTFKTEILTLHPQMYSNFEGKEKYMEHFIGNSFLLAELYLKLISASVRPSVLFRLRYLYWSSGNQYLDLLEKFICSDENSFHKTSLRLSRDIIKKHKKRVLKNPWLYLNMLDCDVVAKYSTSDDAKIYAISFLPSSCFNFWHKNYYNVNKYFLNLIPLGERFSYIKKIFTEKYPGQTFEENYNFFTYKYYKMMTAQEKEDWALRHVASAKELHGRGNDYIWYQFINFEISFMELKKLSLIARSKDKRSNILKILIDSAKTQEELIKLLEYYHSNHIDELTEYKRDFLNNLIKNHNVLSCNNECWTALEKIFDNLGVFNKIRGDKKNHQNNQYRVLSLIYYIIHEKHIPEVFYEFLISRAITISKMNTEIKKFDRNLDSVKLNNIFQYMFSWLTNYVKSLMTVKTEENLNQINVFINDILDLIVAFNKTSEDIPNFINDYIMSENKIFESFRYHQLFARSREPSHKEFGTRDIMHYLKDDASLVVSKFPTIKEYFQDKSSKRNINWLIRKLTIYFNHDIALEYIKLLTECLCTEELYLQTARVVVFGIFNLSDEEYKINFLKKYAPVDSKIDHVNISRNLLTIQIAICSQACHSRPPLPLSIFRSYIKGDYLHYCISIFNSYLANLTPDQCLSFVEYLLDSPVSVQKHGLRLAFNCFSTENLKNLVLKVWKKMKNVSLRKNLYKALFDKVNYYQDNLPAQKELFRALLVMTQDLHQDDDEEVFELLTQQLPPEVFGLHLQSAFTVVNSFPNRTINHQRLTSIIHTIENNVELISKSVLFVIMEDCVKIMLDQNLMFSTDLKDGQQESINAQWNLIKTVIIKHKNMKILSFVVNRFLNKWHNTHDNAYKYRKFWIQFLNDLENLSYQEHTRNFFELNNIFQSILIAMQDALPSIEIYIIVWQLKVSILTRQLLGKNIPLISESDEEITKTVIKEIILKFSRQIRDLMKEYVEKQEYFPLLHDDIRNVISDASMKIRDKLKRFVVRGVSVNDISVLLCSVLVEYDVREVRIFVIQYLCKDYVGTYAAEYLDVVNKLKSVDDEEIQYCMYHKFYSSDYRYRCFMP